MVDLKKQVNQPLFDKSCQGDLTAKKTENLNSKTKIKETEEQTLVCKLTKNEETKKSSKQEVSLSFFS